MAQVFKDYVEDTWGIINEFGCVDCGSDHGLR